MADMFAVKARMNPSTNADEFYDVATKRTTLALAALGTGIPQPVHAFAFTATLAQINAGTVLVAADANRTIIPVRVWLKCVGTFGALTDIRLSDTNGTPVDIATLLQADATDGSIFTLGNETGFTLGAGYAAALTAGAGIKIRKTGASGTTATSVVGVVEFVLG